MKLPAILLLISVCTGAGAQAPGKLLERAYRNKSEKQLDRFFREWQAEVPAITGEALRQLNDTVHAAYRVFQAFYKPESNDSLGDTELGNNPYEGVEYLICQNNLEIYFRDKIYYNRQEIHDYIEKEILGDLKDSTRIEEFRKTNGRFDAYIYKRYDPNTLLHDWNEKENEIRFGAIPSFRPPVNTGKKVLYHTARYDSLINAFLNVDAADTFSREGIPNGTSAEADRRRAFLEKKILLRHPVYRNHWRLSSWPVAEFITFDKDMQYARVIFSWAYEWGETVLKKNSDGSWSIVFSRRTYIS
jgi:hypothetical protein